jgi:hypothetical protein
MKLKGIFILVISLIFTLVMCLASCAGGSQPTPSEVILQKFYLSAVEDARITQPSEISQDLSAVVYYNSDVIWESTPGKSRVLVVTWTSWDGYNDQVSQSVVTGRETWVTLAPDIKDFCKIHHVSGNGTVLRLEQLLGLPPNNGKKWMVEFWTDTGDIFRPAPDSDITDREAGLVFPEGTDLEYISWFNNLNDSSYGSDGYPWTRLGYTYDWGNPKSEVGLSEFVIKAGSTVKVNMVSSTLDYTGWK